MRNLFLGLVLANLAFAAWHFWFAAPPRAPRTDADVPSILLASELGEVAGPQAAPAAPAAELAAVDAAPDEPAATCVSVGPFSELAQAHAAAASLRERGFDPVQHAVEDEISVGYWVYLPGIPTVAQAEEILARLHANGIAEAYVIADSDSGNLISLGVFSEMARAASRLAEARALGYEATIPAPTQRGTVYWLDVTLGAGVALDVEAPQPQGRIFRLEQRPCAAPAA